MDFSAAIRYMFRDSQWTRKFLFMGLISVIPLFGQVWVLGWVLKIARQVIEKQPDVLPEPDLAGDLTRGLKGWGIGLIYALPGIVLGLPLGLGLFLMVVTHSGPAAWMLLVGLCCSALLVGYCLVLTLVLPAAFGNFLAQGEQFWNGMNPKQVFGLVRCGPVAYFLVAVGWVMSWFIALFGLVGCVVGVIFSSLLAHTIMAHLIGQAYREASGL